MNLPSLFSRTGARRPAARGSSLIESMTALAILALGLMGFSTAIVASLGQDRRNNSRAAAQALATELARDMATWRWNDSRLSIVNSYTGTNFSSPKVTSFQVTPAQNGNPATVTETLSPPPDHNESQLGNYAGTNLNIVNKSEPGSTYVFRRYWNVTIDPNNVNMKLIAVHVTYSTNSGRREVATTYQAIMNMAALVDTIGRH